MDRLTRRTDLGTTFRRYIFLSDLELKRVTEQLAAYEDTGLTPEEIERLKKSDASKEQSSVNYYSEAKQLRSEVAALKAENEKLEKDLDEALAVIKDAQGVVARWLAGAPRKEETADE